MPQKRPVNISVIDLMRYWFPLSAIASIMHRISGFVLFLSIPGMVWLLQMSMSSEASYNAAATFLNNFLIKFVLWLLIVALLYHLFAGLKHTIMDMGFAETIKASRTAALIDFALTLVSAVMMGVQLW